jgi:hypothetical protein
LSGFLGIQAQNEAQPTYTKLAAPRSGVVGLDDPGDELDVMLSIPSRPVGTTARFPAESLPKSLMRMPALLDILSKKVKKLLNPLNRFAIITDIYYRLSLTF